MRTPWILNSLDAWRDVLNPSAVTVTVKGPSRRQRTIEHYERRGYRLAEDKHRKQFVNASGAVTTGILLGPIIGPLAGIGVGAGGRRVKYTLTFVKRDANWKEPTPGA